MHLSSILECGVYRFAEIVCSSSECSPNFHRNMWVSSSQLVCVDADSVFTAHSRWYPTSACPLSLHPCNSTYCLKYVLIKFSVALRGEINNLRLKGLIAFVTSCLGGWCIGERSRCPRSLPFCRPGKPPTLPQVSPPGHLEPTSVSLLITRV